MSIPIDKLSRRECLEVAQWAQRIGMFCLAKALLQILIESKDSAAAA